MGLREAGRCAGPEARGASGMRLLPGCSWVSLAGWREQGGGPASTPTLDLVAQYVQPVESKACVTVTGTKPRTLRWGKMLLAFWKGEPEQPEGGTR